MKIKLILRQSLLVVVMLSILVLFQNCDSTPLIDEQSSLASSGFSSPPKYSEVNEKIFESKCLSCHTSQAPNLSTYSSLMSSGAVVPNDPEASTLFQELDAGTMPPGGGLKAAEVEAVYDWIASGAANTSN